jgi:hypothetical protein
MGLVDIGFVAGMARMGMDEIERLASEKIQEWHAEAEERLKGTPYCLMASSIQRNTYDTDLTVPNMRSLIVGGSTNFLVHDVMRMFKKSDVTVAKNNFGFYLDKFFENTRSFEDKVRIRSDGRNAVVTRE